MGFFDKIWTVGRVLQQGESLKNPATWKNFQSTLNSLIVIVGSISVFFPQVQLDAEQTKYLAGGVAVCMGLYNTYFTVATSTKVGLSPRK